ncbi:MAG: TetR family transcriptional regulator [Anaerolinea sp.]|nr:TetR family transcriptional regulator [Anaerolinea sp.]
MNEQDARDQILNAALSLFARQGFAHTSMNDIVRASGVSKGGVYWHFQSKDALILAIFDAFFSEQEAILAGVLNGAGSPAARLRQLVALAGAELETAVARFPAPLEFYTLAAHNETLRARLAHFYTGYHEKLCLLLQEGIGAGVWSGTTAVAPTAHVLISAIEGIILLWSLFPEEINLRDQMDTAVALLLAGLAAEKG